MGRMSNPPLGRVLPAVAALLAASLACSKSGPRALVFAGVPKLQNNAVFEVAHQGAIAKAKELGVELRWNAPREADATQQRQIVNDFVDQRVDGIFLSVNHATVLKKAIDDAVAAGIP